MTAGTRIVSMHNEASVFASMGVVAWVNAWVQLGASTFLPAHLTDGLHLVRCMRGIVDGRHALQHGPAALPHQQHIDARVGF